MDSRQRKNLLQRRALWYVLVKRSNAEMTNGNEGSERARVRGDN